MLAARGAAPAEARAALRALADKTAAALKTQTVPSPAMSTARRSSPPARSTVSAPGSPRVVMMLAGVGASPRPAPRTSS